MANRQFFDRHLAAAAGIAVLATACASSPGHESTGQYVDDSVITTQVLAKLAADSRTSATAINVDTYKGVVQLSGFVDSSAEATSATDIARHVAGVRQVENRLTVKTAADPHAAE